MAGAGYNLFLTGSVLTAAQVNNYLQEQAVMRFASSAARTSALSAVLAEGMMSYLADTNSVEVYNGTAWVAVGGSSPLTTKGDLYGFSTLDARIPIGTNNQVLTADSAQALGLKWAAPAAATTSFVLKNTGGTALTGSASTTVSGLTGGQIMVIVSGASSASASSLLFCRFNGVSTSKYGATGAIISAPVTYSAAGVLTVALSAPDGTTEINLGTQGDNAGNYFEGSVMIYGCKSATSKPFQAVGSGNGSTQKARVLNGVYNDTNAITSISVHSDTGNFDGGTVYVYEG